MNLSGIQHGAGVMPAKLLWHVMWCIVFNLGVLGRMSDRHHVQLTYMCIISIINYYYNDLFS